MMLNCDVVINFMFVMCIEICSTIFAGATFSVKVAESSGRHLIRKLIRRDSVHAVTPVRHF